MATICIGMSLDADGSAVSLTASRAGERRQEPRYRFDDGNGREREHRRPPHRSRCRCLPITFLIVACSLLVALLQAVANLSAMGRINNKRT